ncbi:MULTISPECIES: sensor histidine kinase [unclassified Rathayibacter]|uniref:sensor histidine kinase n=1 Tax=unclassified Rathayibacter TaxID=2609250 RepID=UPI0011B07119|nr:MULTISPECIES: histidine kinase [unclassified Rathayibacter]
MRALLDRPAALPIAGALLAALHLLLGLTGVTPTERIAGGLVLALALAVAGFLPALAPSLVAVGALADGGVLLGGVPVDGVLVGLVVLWQTTRRVGPWTRALALAGGLILAGIGGVTVALGLSGPLDPSGLPARVEFVVLALVALAVASVLGAAKVLVYLNALRAPVLAGDRIDALLTRVAGPQDPFAVGVAGGQALVLLLVAGLPFAGVEGAMQLLVAGVLAVALVLHRRSPVLALSIAWAGAALQMSASLAPGPADLAILAVLFGAGASESRRVRIAGAVSAVLGAVVAVVYLVLVFDLVASAYDGLLSAGATFGGILATLGLSWTIGLLSRSVRRAREGQTLRAQAEQERARAQRELDTVEERNRIARDMHDVVAHSLAVVIAQADGARYLGATSPEQTDAALLTISSVARDALGDVRVLLAQLRHSQSDGPQPGARDLPALLDSVGGAGAPVRAELAVDLEAVPRAVGLALYRIAQEATTNALRHGRPGSPLDIALRQDGGELALTVRNARCADVERDSLPGEGHGLVGMRERAALVGGVLAAGPVGDDFVVDARLPSSPSLARTALPLASGGSPA